MSFKASKSREQLCLRLKSIGVVPRFSMSASMSDKKDDLYESTAKNCLFSKQKSIQHTHKLRKSLKLFRKTFEKIQTSTNTRLYFQHVLVLIYLPHCTSTKKWRVRKQCLGKTIHLGNEDSTKNDLNLFLPLPFFGPEGDNGSRLFTKARQKVGINSKVFSFLIYSEGDCFILTSIFLAKPLSLLKHKSNVSFACTLTWKCKFAFSLIFLASSCIS